MLPIVKVEHPLNCLLSASDVSIAENIKSINIFPDSMVSRYNVNYYKRQHFKCIKDARKPVLHCGVLLEMYLLRKKILLFAFSVYRSCILL